MKKKLFTFLFALLACTGLWPQSAEEASKYGRLQEIHLPQAGKLGKYIKKDDPNVTALKILGELNEKDWYVLYSLPNMAYLDLGDATNIARYYEWKDGKNRVYRTIESKYMLLLFPQTLKYLVVQKNAEGFYTEKKHYDFDKLVVSCAFDFRKAEGVSFRSLKIIDGNCKSRQRNQLDKEVYQTYSGEYIVKYVDIMRNQYDIGERLERMVRCDTLFLAHKEALEWSILGFIDPKFVIIENTNTKILNHDNYSSEVLDLTITKLEKGTFFKNKNLRKINLGSKITEIPDFCFWGCPHLDNIDLTNVTSIGEYAFSFSGIQSIKWPVGADVFNMSCLYESDIKQVDLTNHNYPPMLKGKIIPEIKQNIEFIIPKGTRKNYQRGEWKDINFIEEGIGDTYSFQLDSIGSLQNFLTDDIIPNVKSLTLNGIMDETEFEIIKKCKNLQYLNLEECFTYESTEKARERYLEAKAKRDVMNWVFSSAMEKNEQDYIDGKISAGEALLAHMTLEDLNSLLPKSISYEDIQKAIGSGRIIYREECYFPNKALEGLQKLETLILPKKLIRVKRLFGDIKPNKLKKVQFSNETKVIDNYAFSDMTSLEEINFPDSLVILGQCCFKNCAIHMVDLRKTSIVAWALDDRTIVNNLNSIGLPVNAFFDCPLQEFYSPINIRKPKGAEWLSDKQIEERYGVTKSVYTDEKRMETNNPNMVVLYFYFNEPFCEAKHIENIYGKIKELHIPRGMKAAWRGYENIIDDIDL